MNVIEIHDVEHAIDMLHGMGIMVIAEAHHLLIRRETPDEKSAFNAARNRLHHLIVAHRIANKKWPDRIKPDLVDCMRTESMREFLFRAICTTTAVAIAREA